MATKKTTVERFSFRNYKELARFTTDRAKILNRRRTGLTPKNQRKLAQAIKRARFLGLLPVKPRI